jgi:hypothetical protein
MSQCKHPFSLDWNDADWSRLESEDLLLRNTYINSQMGPLAEFHAGDMSLQGKPRKLMWADNNVDDKIRLEKPAGADRHNVQNCKRNQMGQPILKSVLKAPKHRPGGKGTEQSLLSRPTTASSSENPQEAHRQFNDNVAVSDAPKAPAAAAPMMSGILGTAPGQPPKLSGSHTMQQAPGAQDPTEFPPRAMPTYTFAQQNVPTAWGAEAERVGGLVAGYATGPGGPPLVDEHGRLAGTCPPGPSSGAYPDMAQPAVGPPGYHVMSNSSGPVRGPATNIRDSLCGLSRRESPDPGGRATSRDSLGQSRDPRDPSPKVSSGKRDSPLPYRGESPLRLLSRSGRGSSPGAVAGADKNKQQPNGTGGYNPQFGQIGFALGGIRAGASGGMGAFRSGGPVRAKADLLGAGADAGNSSLRRSRPATAPSQRGSGSRPASPLGQPGNPRASGSRPSSPQTRPSSPGQSTQSKPVVAQAPYPFTQLDKTKHRSLSSHMRRAPSPTPAFNRNPSPSRPRWRM